MKNIELSDMRIGNFMILNGVIVILNLDIFKIITKNTNIEGIELNEELLKKLKFKKQKNYEYINNKKVKLEPYYFDTQLSCSAPNRTSGLYIRNKKIRVLGGHIYKDLEYLHQLQNWFYIATGEELIINTDYRIGFVTQLIRN